MTDLPADTTTNATIAVGATYVGTIDTGGDHDWVAVNLVAGQKYTFTLDGYGSNPLEDPYLYLRDSSGTVLVENDDGDGNRNSRIVFTATTTGTYYLDASAWDDEAHTYQYTGDYVLSAQKFANPPVYTYSQIADQLVKGYWGGDWHHFNVTQGGTITVNLTGLTTAGQTLARAALKEWSDVIGITFKEVSGTNADGTPVGQIVFDDNQDGAFTNSSWTNHIISESDVNVSTQWLSDYGTSLDSYSFQSYVHEIGHALGLGHGGNYNDTATYPDDAVYANDAWSTTVMSYFSQHDSTYFKAQGFSEDFALTPMSADILAMQTLYGLSTTTRTGDTTYGYGSNSGNAVFNTTTNPHAAYTIVDSGGIDTLNYAGTSANELINLNPLTFSNVAGDIGNVSIAVGTVIENAKTGSGNDTIIGNSANNVLDGGIGKDTVSYEAASAGVTVNLSLTTAQNTVGAGTDTLANFENLTGSAYADTLTGNTSANILDGGLGNDTLNGGSGADILTGGSGTDTFVGTAAGLNGDTIVDLSRGETIVVTGASLNNFSAHLSGSTLTFTGGSLTLNAIPAGYVTVAAAPGGGVQMSFQFEFGQPEMESTAFGAAASAGGWSSNDVNPRLLADVNGDGRADVVGFGNDGVYVSIANADGSFGNPTPATTAFGAGAQAGGWSSNDHYPRELADMNGDGKADIIGFGNNGVYVSLATANGGFANPVLETTAFGSSASAGGWTSNDHTPRFVADVNGDGREDIIGFGNDGTYVALANADGSFAAPTLATTAFGASAGAGGWSSNDAFPRAVADVNNDGRADLIGFGSAGVYVSLAQANGTFSNPVLELHEFGAATSGGGWTSFDHFPRELADVNGDGNVDIAGFGNAGVYIALGNGDGTFQPSVFDVDAFGATAGAGGWSSQNTYPRLLADLNHDGAADIVGFGATGIFVSHSNGDIFG